MAESIGSLGHFSLGVKDYDVSKAFYTALLQPFGFHLVFDSETPENQAGGARAGRPRTLGYGPDEDREVVNLFEHREEARAPGPGFHLAFRAPTRQAVREFHAAALLNGGASAGEPGLRLNYGPRYYAAFVIDPDGYKLEAVCKSLEE